MSNDNPDYTIRLSNLCQPPKRSIIDPSLLAIDNSLCERVDALEQEVKLLKEQIRDLEGDLDMTREEMLLWFFASYGFARFLLDLSKMVDWWVKKKKGD